MQNPIDPVLGSRSFCMDPFLEEITSLADKDPPLSARPMYEACALIPWFNRQTQGLEPLRDAVQRHFVMLKQPFIHPTNTHLAADIAASYAIDAMQRRIVYQPPSACVGWDADKAVRDIVEAVQVETRAARKRGPLEMTLLPDGHVSIEFP